MVFWKGFLLALGLLAAAVRPAGAVSVWDFIEQYLGVSLAGPCPLEKVEGIFCVAAKAITTLLGIAAGVAVVFLVVGGLQYMASGGDEKALSTAKATITYAALGLVLVLGAILGINTLLTALVR